MARCYMKINRMLTTMSILVRLMNKIKEKGDG